MIRIVLYFLNAYDGDIVFNKIIDFFKSSDYEFAYDCISNQIFFRNTFEDDCRKEVKIDVRYGDLYKLRGLRPDIYYSDTEDGKKILEQAATNVDGIRLLTWLDVFKLVDLFRG